MKKLTYQKYSISADQKELLEELSGQRIFVRDSFSHNTESIKKLQQQAVENALEYLERKRRGHALSLHEENNLYSALVELQDKLHLQALPKRIECYDISHLSGKFVYGSMVTFIDAKPIKKYYKLFKTKERNDDFANLNEVLTRRFARALEQGDTNPGWALPQLMIIDGGKGQLSSVEKAYNKYRDLFIAAEKPFTVEICALAKGEERIFLPQVVDEELGKHGILFQGFTKFLIQRIRDETHRFGIKNNRNARLRTIQQSELDLVPGIGEKTKKKLLSEFGSVTQIIESLWDSPMRVRESVGAVLHDKLKKHFNII